jgi:hypothetical protein
LREIANESPKDFVQIITGTGSHDQRFEKYYSGMKNWKRNFDEAPFNENQAIIRLNALLMFPSLKTYFVHILFMCFISLLGWVLLTNSVMGLADPRNSILATPIMLLPSVLFWTSGVMKEPVLVLGIGLFICGLIPQTPEGGLKSMPLSPLRRFGALALGFLILLFTRFFVLACLVPAAFAFLCFGKKTSTTLILIKYAVVNTVLLVVAFNISSVVPGIDLQQMLANKQSNSIKEATYFNAGSRIEIAPVEANAISIIKAIPSGIRNTLLRPYPWEGRNIMMLASALENIAVILLILLCLIYSDFKHFRNANPFFFLINFSLAYFALIGICTPVLGNLVRYRAPVLPVLLFALLLNVKPKFALAKFHFLMR